MSITLDGSLGITSPSETVPNTFSSSSNFGFKNKIINGACVIDQRNAGAAQTNNAGVQYPVDRYICYGSVASKFTMQQNAGAITPPVGFSNYIGITSLSAYSILTGDIFELLQRIEGFNTFDLAWGTASASAVTLSFKVYSSLTGTFGGALQNSAGNRSYPFSYSIPVANTWTTISITIAGDTSGTWLTTNGIGMQVIWGLGVGTTYSGTAGAWASAGYYSATGATSVVGTNGATFYITGVQLEKGSTATSFDFRPYGTELSLCQRYYASIQSISYSIIGVGISTSATNSQVSINFPQPMRAQPTISSPDFTKLIISDRIAYDLIASGFASYSSSTNNGIVAVTTAGTATVSRTALFSSGSTLTGYVTLSAEL